MHPSRGSTLSFQVWFLYVSIVLYPCVSDFAMFVRRPKRILLRATFFGPRRLDAFAPAEA